MSDFLEFVLEVLEFIFDGDGGKLKKESIPHFIIYTAAAICLILFLASAWKAIHRIRVKAIDNQT